jgi:uncharacterized protein (DUF1810 family)
VGGGGGVKSYDSEKAGSYIKYSILSGHMDTCSDSVNKRINEKVFKVLFAVKETC